MSDPRLRYGRFYTPDGLVALVTALAVQGNDDRIWDPTCGEGAFLAGARKAGHDPRRLVGTDLDGAAIERARAAFPGASLEEADLFELDPAGGIPGRVDAIVGNPPFVRNERIPAARRRGLTEAVSDAVGERLPPRLDLAALSTLQALRFLRPGGRLAFVLPNTLLDAEAAAPFRRLLTERTRLRAVVEAEDRPWFTEVALNTVIVVVENEEPALGPEPVFARLSAPPDASFAAPILAGREVPGLTLRRARVGDERWTVPLRAPEVYLRTAESAPLRPLAGPDGLLEVGYGTKVGVTAFFSPPADRLAGVEARFVRPFLRSLKGVDRYEVRRPEVEGRLFDCSSDPEAAADPSRHPGAAAWIEAGRAGRNRNGTPWPQVPSLRANEPWYALPPLRTGPVLLPQFRAERHAVLGNPDGVPVNNSAWWGRPREGHDLPLLLGLLNSSWAALSAEVLGRTNLGEGLLTLYGPDLSVLPVPDPAAFDAARADRVRAAWERLAARPVLPWSEEVGRDDRRALDDAVAAATGAAPGWAEAVRDGTRVLMARRLERARARRATQAG